MAGGADCGVAGAPSIDMSERSWASRSASSGSSAGWPKSAWASARDEVPLGHLPAAPELAFETAAPVYMAST